MEATSDLTSLKRVHQLEKVQQKELETNKLKVAEVYEALNIVIDSAIAEAKCIIDGLNDNPGPVDAQSDEQVTLQQKQVHLTKMSKLLKARRAIFKDINIRYGWEAEYRENPERAIEKAKKPQSKAELLGHRKTLANELFPQSKKTVPTKLGRRYLLEPK